MSFKRTALPVALLLVLFLVACGASGADEVQTPIVIQGVERPTPTPAFENIVPYDTASEPEPIAVVTLTCTVPLDGESWDKDIEFYSYDEEVEFPYGCIGVFTAFMHPEGSPNVIEIVLADGRTEELTANSRPELKLDNATDLLIGDARIILRCPRGAC
jgi:hypothetical protein